MILQFDNVHSERDNPNVPSDLEQMPALRSFLTSQRDAADQRPHDPDLAHGRRNRVDRDRAVPRPQRPHGRQQLPVLRPATRRPPATSAARTSPRRSSTGPTRPRPADDQTLQQRHHRRHEHAGAVGPVHARGLRLRRPRRGQHGAREHLQRPHQRVSGGFDCRHAEQERDRTSRGSRSTARWPTAPATASAPTARPTTSPTSRPATAASRAVRRVPGEPGAHRQARTRAATRRPQPIFDVFAPDATNTPKAGESAPPADLPTDNADGHRRPTASPPARRPRRRCIDSTRQPGFPGLRRAGGQQRAGLRRPPPRRPGSPSPTRTSQTSTTTTTTRTAATLSVRVRPATSSQLRSTTRPSAAFFQRLANEGINKANTLFLVTVDEGDHFSWRRADNPGCDGVTPRASTPTR